MWGICWVFVKTVSQGVRETALKIVQAIMRKLRKMWKMSNQQMCQMRKVWEINRKQSHMATRGGQIRTRREQTNGGRPQQRASVVQAVVECTSVDNTSGEIGRVGNCAVADWQQNALKSGFDV